MRTKPGEQAAGQPAWGGGWARCWADGKRHPACPTVAGLSGVMRQRAVTLLSRGFTPFPSHLRKSLASAVILCKPLVSVVVGEPQAGGFHSSGEKRSVHNMTRGRPVCWASICAAVSQQLKGGSHVRRHLVCSVVSQTLLHA